MSLQSITEYLLEHRWFALAMTLLFTFVPMLGVLSIVFAALVTLRKGVLVGGVFALAATLPYFISAITAVQPMPMGPIFIWGAVILIAASNAVTWVLAVLIRKQVSFSTILQWSALLGMLVVSVVHLVYPGVDHWWAEQLTNYFNRSAQLLTKLQGQELAVSTAAQVEAVNVFKYYVTGFVIAAILLNGFIPATVAVWWQAVVFKTGYLRKELLSLRLSKLMGVFFIAGFFLSYLGNRVGLDIMPILYLIFTIVGLSLVHYILAMTKASNWWLIMIYFLLIWAFPYSVFFIALLTLMDAWFDFRRFVRR